MWPFLVRNVVFPTHERLLGRATRRCARELQDTQWGSPADLRRLQLEKLGELLRHTHRHLPFYQKQFAMTGADLVLDDPQEALRRLPLLDKTQIRENLNDLVWREAPGGVFPHNTGGSSGEPLQFFVDRRRQAYDQAARIRSHAWFDVGFGERELFLWGSPIEHRRTHFLKRFRDGLFNQRLLNAFDMSPSRMDEFLDDWDRFQPHSVFGYPSSLALLVNYAKARHRKLATQRLKAVFVTGEVCYSQQRQTMAEYFGVPVADGYGSRDAGFIAHECPEGRMHVTAENVLVEIIKDEQLQPVGELGEIVVTHLDAYAMPFIRYKTGDCGRLLPSRCACGRGLPMMDAIQGRSTDFLHLPNGTTMHALSVIYPLREFPGIRQFRVTQAANYSLNIRVVATDRSRRLADKVRTAVGKVVGADVETRIDFVDSIPVGASGKHRYVESFAVPVELVGEQAVSHA